MAFLPVPRQRRTGVSRQLGEIWIRLIARLIFQLPDLTWAGPYDRSVVRLRRAILGISSGVSVGRDARLHPRFYFPRGVRVVLGDRCEIKRDVRVGREYGVTGPAELRIGPETQILSGCRIDCSESVTIGTASHIGRDSQILTHTHDTASRETPVLRSAITTSPVTIGDDVMIYSDVVILPGITVGDGAVVAVRSVVTGDVKPYAVVAGVPARKIGERT